MPTNNNNSTTTNTLGVTAFAAVAGVVTATAAATYYYLLRPTVEEYGWEGTLKFIWEGDAYPGHIRHYIDILENAEVERSIQESKIHGMETALELARLDSVDDDETDHGHSLSKDTVERWIVNYSPDGNLERTLVNVSDVLDKLAAKVDGVVLSSSAKDDTDTNLMRQIKQRKKILSKVLVNDMERCDALVASFQVLQDRR
jgi:hypothetical protein